VDTALDARHSRTAFCLWMRCGLSLARAASSTTAGSPRSGPPRETASTGITRCASVRRRSTLPPNTSTRSTRPSSWWDAQRSKRAAPRRSYLTLSDATAASVRSQRMVLPSGDCGGGRLEAAAAVWRRLDQALRGEPLSDVAAAEWCAFTADL